MRVPLSFPPGMFHNGTKYQSEGRWYDGSLVRFFKGTVRPIGGWQPLAATADSSSQIVLTGVPRAIIGWIGDDKNQVVVAGTNSKLYAIKEGHLYDITPSGFTAGSASGTYGAGGYGSGLYGAGPYGVQDPLQQTYIPPAVWSLDNFGQFAVGCCAPNDGKLYHWDNDTLTIATVMSGAPTGCVGVVVTPEDYVVALGAGGEARHIAWAGQGGFTNWTTGGAFATGTLTSDGTIPTAGDTVVIGTKTYTFRTVPSLNGEVTLGVSAAAALTNLGKAINLTGTAGIDYSALMTANTDVTAGTPTGTTLPVTAQNIGAASNLVATTETSSHLSWGAATLTGGVDDAGAGDLDVQSRGIIVAGRRAKGETLIWTTDDLHALRYIGGTLIYGLERIGEKCGAVAPNAMASLGTRYFWMGANEFFSYDGYMTPLPCEVADRVFGDMNANQKAKIHAVTRAQYDEITWYYPSSTSDENDRYVTYNAVENHWATGALNRTAGCDAGALLYPILSESTGALWQHELGYVRTITLPTGANVDATVQLESGPIEIGDGDTVMYVSQLVPDERSLGDVEFSMYIAFEPAGVESLHGPFSVNELTDVRLTGRWARLAFTQVKNADWRVGTIKLDVKPGGRR